MKFKINKKHSAFEVVIGDGPFSGAVVGVAEQLQMTRISLNPPTRNVLAEGEITAAWGLCLSEVLNLNAPTVMALGINKPFRTVPYALEARVELLPEPTLVDRFGAILTGPARFLHLEPEGARYVL